jgi:Dynamin GTPase effector domain
MHITSVLIFLQVAFKRFVDYIPMIIDFELLKGFERTLDDALFKGMALGEDQARKHCAAFLKEDPAIIRRRESLHQDLERFEAALADLQNIPALNSSSGYSSDGEAFEAPDDEEEIQHPTSTPVRETPRSRSRSSSRHSYIIRMPSRRPSPTRSDLSGRVMMPPGNPSYHSFDSEFREPTDDEYVPRAEGLQQGSLMRAVLGGGGGTKKKKGKR